MPVYVKPKNVSAVRLLPVDTGLEQAFSSGKKIFDLQRMGGLTSSQEILCASTLDINGVGRFAIINDPANFPQYNGCFLTVIDWRNGMSNGQELATVRNAPASVLEPSRSVPAPDYPGVDQIMIDLDNAIALATMARNRIRAWRNK